MMLSQESQDLARRLLAYETVAGETSGPTESAVVRLCEKLRPPLCTLAGVAGYRSLLSRALALARAQVPDLSAVQVAADGSLQGLAEFDPQIDKAPSEEGSVILIAELLGLFLNFLGAALTLQLLQDVSPHFTITTASGKPMPFENILQEVGQLNNVSERLQSLADENPFVEEALMSISGSIRNTATALEVLALIRNTANRLPKNPPRQQPKQRYLM